MFTYVKHFLWLFYSTFMNLLNLLLDVLVSTWRYYHLFEMDCLSRIRSFTFLHKEKFHLSILACANRILDLSVTSIKIFIHAWPRSKKANNLDVNMIVSVFSSSKSWILISCFAIILKTLYWTCCWTKSF